MSAVRILHLSHTDINYDSRILKEMSALSECEIKYSLYGLGVAMDEGLPASTMSNFLQIDCIKLKSRSFKFLPQFVRHSLSLVELSVKMLVKSVRIRPRIIHCHDTLVLPLGVLLKLISGAKLIYDAHELESDRNGLTPILSKATLLAEKILWSFVDYLIIVSPSIQNWYQNNIGKKASEVILNSPVLHQSEKSSGKYQKNYLRQKYNIESTEMIFIYVGILGKGRGIESLVDVFANRPGAHVVFIGFGEFADLITKHANLYSNIHFHKSVPHEDVVDVVCSADVGLCMIGNVSLSDYYCLPNKLFEYCFAGVPVIASDFPDLMHVVNKFKLGVCCGQDPESIRKAVEIFISNKINMHIDLKSIEELSWEAQKIKLLNVYNYVMNENRLNIKKS
ncbi:MAG: glycosyltransferase [Bacteroidales bacterium]|jgi:glycosyltransferase involved in cell wall biosynthesis